MIDLHTHILPGMDDGSANVEESAAILAMLKKQGVDTLAATSHFYADRENPDMFLRRREQALASLQTDLRILPGAEVAYFPGMHQSEALKDLCIGVSNLLLVEMPFRIWSDRVIREVLAIREQQGLQVVLAHVDRYRGRECMGRWAQTLLEEGILFQVNADALLKLFHAGSLVAMARAGNIHFLGSDCHNLTDRAPAIGIAAAKLSRKIGEEALQAMDARARELLKL